MNNCSGEVIMIEVEKKGIGKAKVGLLIPIILVVILAVSNVWSYTTLSNEKDNLQNHVNTFQSNKFTKYNTSRLRINSQSFEF